MKIPKDQVKRVKRLMRHRRVRAKIFGTKDRPRLSVFRSKRNLFLQLIDDGTGRTLASVSTLEFKGASTEDAVEKTVGKKLAEKALSLGIKQAVFDRGGYKYHGRVARAAAGAREGGLKI